MNNGKQNARMKSYGVHARSPAETILWVPLLLIAAGCGPKIETVTVSPTNLVVRGIAACSVDVRRASSGVTYNWNDTAGGRGAFDAPTARLTSWHAPDNPGSYILSVEVSSGTWRDSKSVTVQVSNRVSVLSQLPPTSKAPANENQGPSKTKTTAPAALEIREPFDIDEHFKATGFMGAGESYGEESIKSDPACEEAPHSRPTCWRWSCTLSNVWKEKWAGVQWQFPENNWQDMPGADLSKGHFTKVIFWAKGARGVEVIKFEAGIPPSYRRGKDYPASFHVMATVKLEKAWTRHELSLEGRSLTNVPCAFVWSVEAAKNPGGATFYLDDIRYE